MKHNIVASTAIFLVALNSVSAFAQTGTTQSNQALLERIEKLEMELASLRAAVQETSQNASQARDTADSATLTVKKTEKKI